MRGPNKKICIARTLVAAGVAMSTIRPLPGLASDGTITFTGAVTENSCTVRVNGAGTGDGAVALPVVDTRALGVALAQKSTAAGTFFTISVSACNVPTRVAAYFEAGPNMDPASHALINTGTSSVVVKLFEASGAAVVGAQISPGTSGTGQPVAGEGTWYFYAGYALAADGLASPGTVSTSVTYSVVYL
jgi:major type 1 subunit fimbrin (pilin)